jgi:hypothetical protein
MKTQVLSSVLEVMQTLTTRESSALNELGCKDQENRAWHNHFEYSKEKLQKFQQEIKDEETLGGRSSSGHTIHGST